MPNQLVIKTKVASVERKSETVSTRPTGKVGPDGKPEFETLVQDLGWFVRFERSHESLFFGMERPKTEVGRSATIRITLE
jgi:hypothetical protein